MWNNFLCKVHTPTGRAQQGVLLFMYCPSLLSYLQQKQSMSAILTKLPTAKFCIRLVAVYCYVWKYVWTRYEAEKNPFFKLLISKTPAVGTFRPGDHKRNCMTSENCIQAALGLRRGSVPGGTVAKEISVKWTLLYHVNQWAVNVLRSRLFSKSI